MTCAHLVTFPIMDADVPDKVWFVASVQNDVRVVVITKISSNKAENRSSINCTVKLNKYTR